MTSSNHKYAVPATDSGIHPDDAAYVRFLLTREDYLDTAADFSAIVRRLASAADYRATVSEKAVEPRPYFRLLLSLAIAEDPHHDKRRADRAERDRAADVSGIPF